ncbi:MAG: hypothetical protein ABI947_11965 [Chloroflexota bacterium]
MNDEAAMLKEKYDSWYVVMDDALEEFYDLLPPDLCEKLDYSFASLDVLEDWILLQFSSIDDIQKILLRIREGREPGKEAQILDGASRYVGETFIRLIGGYWDVPTDDPRNVYYGIPIVTGYKERPTPECPITLVTASTDRRTGKYIRTVFENISRSLPKKAGSTPLSNPLSK